METKTKKLIAREFLVLCVVIGLTLLVFLSTFIYNYYQSKQISQIDESIIVKKKGADSLTFPYRKKTTAKAWFKQTFWNTTKAYGAFTNDDWDSFTKWAKKDTLNNFWSDQFNLDQKKVYQEMGFAEPKHLVNFFLHHESQQADIDKFNEGKLLEATVINKLKQERNKIIHKKVSAKHRKSIALYTFLILLLLAFGIRYVCNSIRWSIKTLKS